jgi:hypothetical protein
MITNKSALFTGKGFHMKRVKKIFAVAALSLSMLATSVAAQNIVGVQETLQAETIKLSRKTLNLKIGESATLKISGMRKTAKWSSGNKYVASVNKSGKVLAVGEGTTYVKAKIAKKTLSCKVTVTSSFNANKVKKNISIEYQDSGHGVVAILKNNNKVNVDLDAKLVYYKNGKMLDSKSDCNRAFESGKECVLYFDAPSDSDYNDVSYDNYKMSLSVDEATNAVCDVRNIMVQSDIGADNVTVEATNDSGKDFSFVKISCVMYDASGNLIKYDYHYAECEKNGDTDYFSFSFPYDSNYDTIYPSSYKIYVDEAYTYTWLQ